MNDKKDDTSVNSEPRRHYISIVGRRIPMPRSRMTRIVIGSIFVVFGMFGFLPILGFWMIPFGLLILSRDLPWVRRRRRRLEIWWYRRKEQKQRQKESINKINSI